jgi:hypothetical protein
MHTEINNSSNFIDFLNERFPAPDTVVCYLYCNHKEPDQTALNLVASLLWQMVQVQPEISRNIAALQPKYENLDTCPSLKEYGLLLKEQAEMFSKIFIIIDAL